MKKLIASNVIQINYDRFLKQYKKYLKNEEPANDKELYEHFVINHLSYSRPVGCLPPNYFHINEGHLKGINIFEIIEYVNISERMFKCHNDITEDVLGETSENNIENDRDSDETEMFDEEEGSTYTKGKKGSKNIKVASKASTKKTQLKKNNTLYNNNDNYNKCKRVYRFLLFDGKRFIYAYEDEFNEHFNYLDNEDYEYPKILLYNKPVIRSGVLLIRKNQATILFKGYKTGYIMENETEANETEKKEDELSVIRVPEAIRITYEKQQSREYTNFENKIKETQPKIVKDEIILLESDKEQVCSSYFRKKKNADVRTDTDFRLSIPSNVPFEPKNHTNNKLEQKSTDVISNYNLIHDISPNNEEHMYHQNDSIENNHNKFNFIANFDNEERKLWEKNKNKHNHINTDDKKNPYHKNKSKEQVESNKLKTSEEPHIIDLTDDFFNSDFFISAVGSGNSDKSDNVIVIND